MKMETAPEEHDDPNAQNTYGQSLNLTAPDSQLNQSDHQGIDGKFLPAQPSSKPNSSKNKKGDGHAREHSQASKHSKPLNQSANDTIDQNSQAGTKVAVKPSLTGK